MNTYKINLKENQTNHPISSLNTYLVIVLYYCCLYQYSYQLNENESPNMIHFCAVYPGVDTLLMLISFIAIKQVKNKASNLIENNEYKEYKQEAKISLADILYLPQEFESDDGEEDF